MFIALLRDSSLEVKDVLIDNIDSILAQFSCVNREVGWLVGVGVG